MLVPRALARLGPRELLVHELFESIQGESTHAGRPCFFIRLTGCHLRCRWCDTEYAFHGGVVMTVEECLTRATASGRSLVEVTGGEPLLQKSVFPLLEELCDRGFEVLLETSGSMPLERVDPRVRRIIDWKCPGSGMETRNRDSVLDALRPGDELKLVVLDRRDYEWAREWVRSAASRIPAAVPVHLSPVTEALAPDILASWILEDRLPVRLNLQLHRLIWGPDARGV